MFLLNTQFLKEVLLLWRQIFLRAFSSSMEIFIDVWIEDTCLSGNKTKCNEAIYTFVAVDNMGKPIKVSSSSS